MPRQACRNAIHSARREQGAHAALMLNRFLQVPYKDERHPAERHKLYMEARQACEFAIPFYSLAFSRRRNYLRADVEAFLTVQGRLIVGLGGESVLETGITLHHTYGTPVIPGSALKGLASHYCDQVWGNKHLEFKRDGIPDKDKDGQPITRQGLYHHEIFGTTDDSGHIIFHDTWITPESLQSPNQGLVLDVMTPHHGDYYMAEVSDNILVPTDFDNPNPIVFLAVAGTFYLALSCDATGDKGKKWAYLALTLLMQALAEWGVGGKTNAGYGRIFDQSQAAPIAPPRPRYKAGEQVTVRRIEDPKSRGRVWFQADDGFGGVVTRGAPPQVEIGDTVSLWIAAVSNGYNFSTDVPQQPRSGQEKGRRHQ